MRGGLAMGVQKIDDGLLDFYGDILGHLLLCLLFDFNVMRVLGSEFLTFYDIRILFNAYQGFFQIIFYDI